jgi:predicted nucleic acid-binding protein
VIVVDASALVEVLLNTSSGSRITERLFDRRETLHAPCLLDIEVAQVLRRYALTGELSETRGLQAMEDLSDFPLIRYPHDPFLPRIWELRHNVTAYDAVYIALAEALDAPLLTGDATLASATGHHAAIELI